MRTDRRDVADTAVRLARTAAGHTLGEVADAAGVNPATLRSRLEAMRWRGRCDDLLATNADALHAHYVAAKSLHARRVVMKSLRWPPAAKRVAASKRRRFGDGTATWSVPLADILSRSMRRVSAPRVRTTDPFLAAAHTQCPPLLLVHLSNNPAAAIRRSVIDNSSCPQVVIHKFVSDPSSWVRSEFAASGHCPQSMLSRLAADDDSEVREAVLAGACPQNLVTQLASDPDQRVRYRAASHRQCPRDVLKHLARSDEDLQVVTAAVENPNLGDADLTEIIVDANSATRVIIAGLVYCPVDVAETLATDPDEDVRVAVVRNDHCPHDLLERLAETDPSSRVRSEADTNLVEADMI